MDLYLYLYLYKHTGSSIVTARRTQLYIYMFVYLYIYIYIYIHIYIYLHTQVTASSRRGEHNPESIRNIEDYDDASRDLRDEVIHTCGMTRSYVRDDSFTRFPWLAWWGCSHVRHDSFLCDTWTVRTRDMTRSDMKLDSFVCETWLIQTLPVTCGMRSLIFTGKMVFKRFFPANNFFCRVKLLL